MTGIKINKLEIENVKRVKAVRIEPSANGLTIIGGNNNQGKTSVIDSIAWALGGNKYKPSQATRDGSVTPPNLHMVMSNGLIIERKGKNSDLKVIDPSGQRGGQGLLDSFVEELAINLPKFMDSSNKEKANILLQIIGVGERLFELEQHENEIYNKRRTIGQIADQKKKFADEQTYFADAPKELVSASELIQQQQAILAINGENQRKRQNVRMLEQQHYAQTQEVERLSNLLQVAQDKLETLTADLGVANTDALTLLDESTEKLEQSITQVDEINRKVRANFDKDKAEQDAAEYRNQYDVMSAEIDDIRKEKSDLLHNADLPLSGLSVEDGELIYNGQRWDNMSGSDQLKVSTAIVRKLKPSCGFILLDKLEQMDMVTLNEFGKWLEEEGLQAIATRVSTGDECSIIIHDGYVVGQEIITVEEPQEPKSQTWKAGEF
jgi:DNA repair exonuclease SbcCD ATPase subunit